MVVCDLRESIEIEEDRFFKWEILDLSNLIKGQSAVVRWQNTLKERSVVTRDSWCPDSSQVYYL